MTPHYLNVPNEEWEYSEVDRKTGRPKRMKFQVPRYLDPRDPGCWTTSWGLKDDSDGEVIVCYEGKGDSSDVVFFGDPTPDMMPVDDEAKAITATFEARWQFKPENSAGEFSQSLIDNFQIKLAEASAKPQTVEVAGLSDLVASISKLVEASAPARRV